MNKKLISYPTFLCVAGAIALLSTGCAKQFNNDNGSVKLSIDSISPTTGPVGTAVLLFGKGFSTIASQNKVHFAGSAALAVVDSNTSYNVLKVYAPNAPNGGSGPITISVNGDSATGPVFKYGQLVPPPVIDEVLSNGPLVIYGNYFDSLNSVVSVGGQVVTGFSFSRQSNVYPETLFRQTFAPTSATNNPADITVTVNGQVSNVYSFMFYPLISAAAPDTAFANKPVTLTGIYFGNRTVTSTLRAYYIDGNARKTYMSPDPTINSWNGTTIQATLGNYDAYKFGSNLITIYMEMTVGADVANKGILYQ
jgi:hypothetical protein